MYSYHVGEVELSCTSYRAILYLIQCYRSSRVIFYLIQSSCISHRAIFYLMQCHHIGHVGLSCTSYRVILYFMQKYLFPHAVLSWTSCGHQCITRLKQESGIVGNTGIVLSDYFLQCCFMYVFLLISVCSHVYLRQCVCVLTLRLFLFSLLWVE